MHVQVMQQEQALEMAVAAWRSAAEAEAASQAAVAAATCAQGAPGLANPDTLEASSTGSSAERESTADDGGGRGGAGGSGSGGDGGGAERGDGAPEAAGAAGNTGALLGVQLGAGLSVPQTCLLRSACRFSLGMPLPLLSEGASPTRNVCCLLQLSFDEAS